MRRYTKTIATFTLFLLSVFSVRSQELTLHIESKTVKEAIETIKEKSGYAFIFEAGDLDTQKIVSVSADRLQLAEVVQQVLAGQNVSFSIQGRNIIIKKKEKTESRQATIRMSGTVTDRADERENLLDLAVGRAFQHELQVPFFDAPFGDEDAFRAETLHEGARDYRRHADGIQLVGGGVEDDFGTVFAAGRRGWANRNQREHSAAGHVYLFLAGIRQRHGQQENGGDGISYKILQVSLG